MLPVVDAAWARERGDDVVLADCRWYLDGRSGRAAYDAGHIPGAVFVDLDTALTRHADAGRRRSPSARRPGRSSPPAMGGARDRRRRRRVAYDDAGGVIAARLVWMLRVTGHEAALLDGGLTPGTAGRRPRPRTRRLRPAATFTARALARPTGRSAGRSDDAVRPRAGRPGAHRRPPARALPRRARRRRPARRPHPRRPQPPLPRELDAAGGAPARGAARAASGGRRRHPGSSPTAAPASPPATTCWRWSTPGSAAAASTPAPGRSGATTPRCRWRPETSPSRRAAADARGR